MHLLPWGNNLAAEVNSTPLENPNTRWEIPYNRLSEKKLVDLPMQWYRGESALLSHPAGTLPTLGQPPARTHPWHFHTRSLPMPSPAGRWASSSIQSSCALQD